jgi:hypothetical protein
MGISVGSRIAAAAVMPIRYAMDDVHRRLLTRADGLLTFHDIHAHLDLEERNRDLGVPELFDARAATTDLTAEQVRRLVRRAADMLRVVDLGATAIVTTNDVLYGMARMYSVLAESEGAAADVFYDMESATRWLEQFDSMDE